MRHLMTLLLSCFCLSLAPVALAQQPSPQDFSKLAEDLSPAVVNIFTSQIIEAPEDLPSLQGTPLEQFGDFFGDGGSVSRSLGSGFVIDPSGYIVTNNHVIEGADEISVNFPDGTYYQAELVGRDPQTDIAVLKIDAGRELPFVRFGSSDDLLVGEWVVAIGNPFGYGGSVAAGIVSARNRNLGQGAYDDFIQTDVAINRGNSGGPLFNLDGEVVGVNTAIISPTGYSIGISFASPSDLVSHVVDQLIQYGETRRGRLGIRTREVTPDIADAYGLDKTFGALVTRVDQRGPADLAGLQAGDLVLVFDGEDVRSTQDLRRMIAERQAGDAVEIEFIRRKRRQSVTATLERLKEDVTADDLPVSRSDALDGEFLLGVKVEDLTQELIRRENLPRGIEGVRVVAVDPDSSASGKLIVGDIIQEVSWEKIQTARQFETVVSELDGGQAVTVLICRGNETLFYGLRPS